MLDQLPLADSEPRSKATGKSGNVEPSVRHLSHEDLKAYASGRLAAARLKDSRAHLDACEACRAELEDIRNFESDLAAFPPSSLGSELQRRKRRRRLTLIKTASVATIVVAAGVAAFFVWGKPRLNRTPTLSAAASTRSTDTPLAAATDNTRAPTTVAAAPVAPSPASVATAPAVVATARAAVASAPAVQKSASAAPIQHVAMRAATDVSPSRERAPIASGAAGTNAGFAVLAPLGDTISDTRPEFKWQPLAGAIGYSVRIVDEGLHPVQHSPAMRGTSWRPRKPLRPGHTYIWQVTATLHGGRQVVAASPPASQRVLKIAPSASR